MKNNKYNDTFTNINYKKATQFLTWVAFLLINYYFS